MPIGLHRFSTAFHRFRPFSGSSAIPNRLIRVDAWNHTNGGVPDTWTRRPPMPSASTPSPPSGRLWTGRTAGTLAELAAIGATARSVEDGRRGCRRLHGDCALSGLQDG